jgi:tRNA threonylcarbamoyladenosine modification (KEOPS) complex  Pcc1 subunit
MAAATHNFLIEQGTTFTKSFIWKDSTGSVISLTGFTARMQIRQNVSASSALLTATTENGKIDIVDDQGKIIISLSATDTAALNFNTAVYDLELISSASEVTRLVGGTITLSLEVTR